MASVARPETDRFYFATILDTTGEVAPEGNHNAIFKVGLGVTTMALNALLVTNQGGVPGRNFTPGQRNKQPIQVGNLRSDNLATLELRLPLPPGIWPVVSEWSFSANPSPDLAVGLNDPSRLTVLCFNEVGRYFQEGANLNQREAGGNQKIITSGPVPGTYPQLRSKMRETLTDLLAPHRMPECATDYLGLVQSVAQIAFCLVSGNPDSFPSAEIRVGTVELSQYAWMSPHIARWPDRRYTSFPPTLERMD